MLHKSDHPPAPADGALGDYWLDQTDNTMYGPKGSTLTNMYANGSLEYGLGSWGSASGNGSVALSSDAMIGTQSLRTNRVDPGQAAYFDPGVMAPAKGNTVYTIATWVKPLSGTNGGMTFMVSSTKTDGSNNVNLFPTVGTMPTGVWSRVSLQFTSPVDTKLMRVLPHWVAGGTVASILFDGLTLVEGATDPGYFDGDMAGYQWTGSPGNSLSVGIGWAYSDSYGTAPEPPEHPHFAWPFQRGNGGKINVVEQDTTEHIVGQQFAVICTPLGYRPSRPDFGWEWPEFQTLPLNLGDLREAISRLVPDADVDAQEWADQVTQAIRHIRLSQRSVLEPQPNPPEDT